MDDKQRRDTARHVEIATSAVAGSVGSALGAAKLRDAYKDEHPKAFARGEKAVGRTTSPKVARFIGHAKPGFKPLAGGAATAIAATAASKYRQKKDHEVARAHAGQTHLEKAAVGVSFQPKLRAKPLQGVKRGLTAVKLNANTAAMVHGGKVMRAMELGTEMFAKGAPNWAILKRSGRRVRVLHQHSTDHFMVMDNTDTQRLVHRDHLTFIKARAKVAKKADNHFADQLEDRVSAVDEKTRKLRLKVVPTRTMVAAKVVDTAAQVKDDVRDKLKKDYDPDRGRRVRARAVEIGSAAGAAGLAGRSITDRRAASRHFDRKAVAEKTAQHHFTRSKTDAAEVSSYMDDFVANAAGKFKSGRRAPNRPNFRQAASFSAKAQHGVDHGTSAFRSAYTHGQKGHRLLRRANKGTLAAAGLTAIALKARSAANRHEH